MHIKPHFKNHKKLKYKFFPNLKLAGERKAEIIELPNK